ncbi:flagellar motor switch protein FliN [Yersinia enterocolitica]|uniref:Flagellar motor switch protein FliN n=1 Tax=Yersinia enterocolitica TaxID=630 RepID=A0A0H5GZ28_YEREN|nr:flagellar motor switch protein FliN [Yersinia enterocolitica]EKN3690420.1 flagellar motor switch protein FliN [Yersinia enterocolitica]EKN4097392.1 flagellar motor switch protein FliN [Yersinia enterocolitica]EKN6285202.1 flagellar motor switch protein FliN [Yersinia enterocolitica]EKN6289352.1 flagellar motor switch protein FliN [Yersinia enterocolitica]EKN6301218.1 flagellar motor switch protein FliN [Yersinia enterocolitica]
MTDQSIELSDDLDFNFSEQENEVSAPISVASVAAPVVDNSLHEQQRKISLFSRIPVTLTLEVASVDIPLSELMSVNNDSVIELDKLAGEPLDIKINGIMFGQAEVVVINEKYGLRIISFNSQSLGELAL